MVDATPADCRIERTTCYACQELLKRFEAEGDGFLGRIVTGAETWAHYYQPETEKASKEWRHTYSSKPKKFRTNYLRER
jgi:hypothetical protein